MVDPLTAAAPARRRTRRAARAAARARANGAHLGIAVSATAAPAPPESAPIATAAPAGVAPPASRADAGEPSDVDMLLQRTLTLLGGRKVLRATPGSRMQVHDLVSAGLPASAIEALEANCPAVTRDHLCAMLGTSVRTLQRLAAERGARLAPDKSGTLWDVAALLVKAERVLGERALAMAWIERPQRALEGRMPIELMRTAPGRQEVGLLLDRLEHGVHV